MCNKRGSHLSVIPTNWKRQRHAEHKYKPFSTFNFRDSEKAFYVLINNPPKNNTTQHEPVETQQLYGRSYTRGTKREREPTNNFISRKKPKIYETEPKTSIIEILDFNEQKRFKYLSNVNNLFKNNEIFISHADFKILKKIYPKRKDFAQMGGLIAKFIHDNKIGYPYRNYDHATAKRSFQKLTKVKIDFWNLIEKGSFDFRRFYSDMNYDPTKKETNPFYELYVVRKKAGDRVAEWVMEKIRSSCGKTSSIKNWYSKRLDQTCAGILSCISPMTMSRLRGLIERSSKRCSNFRPTNVLAIITFLEKYGLKTENGIHVLDTSAGFGGRLVGSLADKRVRSYTGIDPNTELHHQYKKIADIFSKITNTETFFICKPSEELTKSDWPHQHKFDLLLTSPPYYDNEKYTDDPTQSWVRYIKYAPDRETGEWDWREKYLYPTLYNAWKRLKDGGFFALNIADVNYRKQQRQICKPMIEDYIIPVLRMKYMGCIGIVMKRAQGKGVGEPVWIFQKSLLNSKIPIQITPKKNLRFIVNLKKKFELLRSQKKQIPNEWWEKLDKYLIDEFESGAQLEIDKLNRYFGFKNNQSKQFFNRYKTLAETSRQSNQNTEMTNSLHAIKMKFEEFREQQFSKNSPNPKDLWIGISKYYIKQVRQGRKPRPIIRELQKAFSSNGPHSPSIINHIERLIDGNIYDVENSHNWRLNWL